MSPNRVLVVDASPVARHAIASLLEHNGFEVFETRTGADALARVATGDFEVVVLDLGLEDASGLSALRQLRRTSFVPVMMTGANAEVEQLVVALEMGADDYLAKPFAPRELLARVRALLRRTQVTADPITREVELDGLHIDIDARQVTLRGQSVDLTTKEFDLLTFLARSPRHVFTREDLLREVWSSKTEWQDPATVTEHVRRVRRKIEVDPAHPRMITTVRSVGYRFESLALSAA
jgi:DNA-binding response OmpR family regulator